MGWIPPSSIMMSPVGEAAGLPGEEEAAVSSRAEENKALVRRFLEAHARGDLDTLEEMLAPDFVDHNLIPGQLPGREGYLRSFTAYHAAYSHTRYVIDKQLAEGDEVVTTFAVSATHDRGEWMGLVPTGKEFEARRLCGRLAIASSFTAMAWLRPMTPSGERCSASRGLGG
jgi:ketosteroid isomerase-like protein